MGQTWRSSRMSWDLNTGKPSPWPKAARVYKPLLSSEAGIIQGLLLAVSRSRYAAGTQLTLVQANWAWTCPANSNKIVVLGDSAEKKTIQFDDNFDSIRFNSTKLFIDCSPLHLHHHMASLSMVMLILFFLYLFSLYILIECWMLCTKTLVM